MDIFKVKLSIEFCLGCVSNSWSAWMIIFVLLLCLKAISTYYKIPFWKTLGNQSLCNEAQMVFCYQNYSDLLWEKKNVLVIEKNFWIFEITRTIYSNSERSEQFLVRECFLIIKEYWEIITDSHPKGRVCFLSLSLTECWLLILSDLLRWPLYVSKI